MQPDLAAAQAATLREWSDLWQRQAIAGQTAGCGEVSFLLLRTARLIEGLAADPRHVEAPVEAPLQPAAPTLELREG